MMTGRKYWKEISLVFGLILLYRDSFFARFFQDDFILQNIAKTSELLEPIPNFPYRPIAIQFFYSLSSDPFILHSLMFIFFLGGLYLIYKIKAHPCRNFPNYFIGRHIFKVCNQAVSKVAVYLSGASVGNNMSAHMIHNRFRANHDLITHIFKPPAKVNFFHVSIEVII